METIYIDQMYDLGEFDKVTREYHGKVFDIVFYKDGQVMQRIMSIAVVDKDKYVFSNGRTIDDTADANGCVPLEDGTGLVKIKYSKKEFMLWCGVDKMIAMNTAIQQGNSTIKTIHDLLMSADYIDITDDDTVQMLNLLIVNGILTSTDVERIVAGKIVNV